MEGAADEGSPLVLDIEEIEYSMSDIEEGSRSFWKNQSRRNNFHRNSFILAPKDFPDNNPLLKVQDS